MLQKWAQLLPSVGWEGVCTTTGLGLGQPFMASALGTSDPMEVLLGNSLELSETPN